MEAGALARRTGTAHAVGKSFGRASVIISRFRRLRAPAFVRPGRGSRFRLLLRLRPVGRATLLVAIAVGLAGASVALAAGSDDTPPPASAAKPRAPAEPLPPLRMSADRLDLDVEAGTAVLTGHVELAGGAMSLRCPRVDVRYDHVPHVTWARGTGGVVAEVSGVRAEAPEVEVDVAARALELRGGVRLTRGEGWLTADRARIDLATGKVSMSEVKGSIPIQAGAAGVGALPKAP